VDDGAVQAIAVGGPQRSLAGQFFEDAAHACDREPRAAVAAEMRRSAMTVRNRDDGPLPALKTPAGVLVRRLPLDVRDAADAGAGCAAAWALGDLDHAAVPSAAFTAAVVVETLEIVPSLGPKSMTMPSPMRIVFPVAIATDLPSGVRAVHGRAPRFCKPSTEASRGWQSTAATGGSLSPTAKPGVRL